MREEDTYRDSLRATSLKLSSSLISGASGRGEESLTVAVSAAMTAVLDDRWVMRKVNSEAVVGT